MACPIPKPKKRPSLRAIAKAPIVVRHWLLWQESALTVAEEGQRTAEGTLEVVQGRVQREIPELKRRLEAAERLIKCRVCGRVTIDESMCYACLDEDVADIVKTHTMLECADKTGAWEICSPCGTSWPCDALKALHAQHVAQSRLATVEEALREIEREIDGWVQAYGSALIHYPSKEELQAVNETPEFVIGRNAMMQVVSEGLRSTRDKARAALPKEEGR